MEHLFVPTVPRAPGARYGQPLSVTSANLVLTKAPWPAHLVSPATTVLMDLQQLHDMLARVSLALEDHSVVAVLQFATHAQLDPIVRSKVRCGALHATTVRDPRWGLSSVASRFPL